MVSTVDLQCPKGFGVNAFLLKSAATGVRCCPQRTKGVCVRHTNGSVFYSRFVWPCGNGEHC